MNSDYSNYLSIEKLVQDKVVLVLNKESKIRSRDKYTTLNNKTKLIMNLHVLSFKKYIYMNKGITGEEEGAYFVVYKM